LIVSPHVGRALLHHLPRLDHIRTRGDRR
jgi:hypothetical protein